MKKSLLLLMIVFATWAGITWGGVTATAASPFNSPVPPSAACKNGGWQHLRRADGSHFKNQGDCIQYFNKKH